MAEPNGTLLETKEIVTRARNEKKSIPRMGIESITVACTVRRCAAAMTFMFPRETKKTKYTYPEATSRHQTQNYHDSSRFGASKLTAPC